MTPRPSPHIPRPSPILAALLVLAALTAATPRAHASDPLRVRIDLRYDGDRSFSYTTEVDPSELRRLDLDPAGTVRPILREARASLARKLGYRPDLFGDGYLKIVPVREVRYRVEDTRNGRLVAEGDMS